MSILLRHGSLFSGIGGFDLAAEWMGWENIFHCEWNPFGQKVLKHYWPNSISYNDITKTDFTIHRGAIDILTGGFPCQPYSSAGKRLGKEDERHLWPEMLRAIREIQPRWIVGENVLGLVNWNGGMVFEEVQADLEAEGYEVQPYVLPAAAVGAPHRRDRVWFVAHAISSSKRANEFRSIRSEDGEIEGERAQTIHDAFRSNGIEGTIADSDSRRLERSIKVGWNCEYVIRENGTSSQTGIATNTNRNGLNQCNSDNEINTGEGREYAQRDIEQSNGNGYASDTKSEGLEREGRKRIGFAFNNTFKRIWDWNSFPTVSPICSRNDGLSTRLDGITFSKWRNESIKAGGNAIVPQVVFQIFKAIELFNQQNQIK
jgi:DNA (cytosine-5)-methyltransferase 1